MRLLVLMFWILAVELVWTAPHSGMELDPLKFLIPEPGQSGGGSFVSPSDVTHAFLSHPSPSPPSPPSPPHHGYSAPKPLSIPDPVKTDPAPAPVVHPMKAYADNVGSNCRLVRDDTKSSSFACVESTNCKWDGAQCFCSRSRDQCVKEKACYWFKDDKTQNTECISQAERFYKVLGGLLSKRGKKDFAIRIAYKSAPSRGYLPHGPLGMGIYGFGAPSSPRAGSGPSPYGNEGGHFGAGPSYGSPYAIGDGWESSSYPHASYGPSAGHGFGISSGYGAAYAAPASYGMPARPDYGISYDVDQGSRYGATSGGPTSGYSASSTGYGQNSGYSAFSGGYDSGSGMSDGHGQYDSGYSAAASSSSGSYASSGGYESSTGSYGSSGNYGGYGNQGGGYVGSNEGGYQSTGGHHGSISPPPPLRYEPAPSPYNNNNPTSSAYGSYGGTHGGYTCPSSSPPAGHFYADVGRMSPSASSSYGHFTPPPVSPFSSWPGSYHWRPLPPSSPAIYAHSINNPYGQADYGTPSGSMGSAY